MSRQSKPELLDSLLLVQTTAGELFDALEASPDGIMPKDSLRVGALLHVLLGKTLGELRSHYVTSERGASDFLSEVREQLSNHG